MKLTALAKALSVAAKRLNTAADVRAEGTAMQVGFSPTQLAYAVGFWLLRFNTLDPISTTDGAGVLYELYVSVFKNFVDDAALAEDVAFEFQKTLRDEAGLSDTLAMQLFRSLAESAGVADAPAWALSKPQSDAYTAQDLIAVVPTKVRNDEAQFSDAEVLDFIKTMVEGAGANDAYASDFSKLASDDTTVSSFPYYTMERSVSDQVFATDDLDGNASLLDDELMVFVKQRNDIAAVADAITILLILTRDFNETVPVSDSGSLRSQGYCDFTYFAEDYVGASRTF